MTFTKTPMLRLAAVLGLGALLLSTTPATAKPKSHGGKSHAKWEKQYEKLEHKDEKRWAKQERKDAKRWQKENRQRAEWDDDRTGAYGDWREHRHPSDGRDGWSRYSSDRSRR